MHATAEEEADDEDDFLVKKPGQTRAANDAPRPQITERDIQVADKDPETFLSNFMQSRAWVPDEKSRFDAFDSDDSEDERRAEMFEDAYNMRFEDPTKANEKLMTFSRDVAKLSARREEKSGRKKQREKEREKKEAIKRERTEEKARLRKLKIDEVEEKVKKIKEAAGLKNQALDLGEWKQVLDEDWDDDHWEQEMKRRFGDNYYSEKDAIVEDDADEEEEEDADKTKKPHKPKWDDDIDINDLVPETKRQRRQSSEVNWPGLMRRKMMQKTTQTTTTTTSSLPMAFNARPKRTDSRRPPTRDVLLVKSAWLLRSLLTQI